MEICAVKAVVFLGNGCELFFFSPHIRTLHLDVIKVLFIQQLIALVSCLKKTILKFTLELKL